MRRHGKTIKVLHCPKNVVGNPSSLARAERELGLNSWSISFTDDSFIMNSDEVLWNKDDNVLIREMKRWQFAWRALTEFDIIHYNFGQSIMPKWYPAKIIEKQYPNIVLIKLYQLYASIFELKDLWLYKKAGKVIVVTYQGDDARQGDYCKRNFNITFSNEVDSDYYLPEDDNHKRWEISKFAEYADRIYSLNPDLLHVLPPQAQFLPYAHVYLDEWRVPSNINTNKSRPLVIHAPTERSVKGTRYILDAVSRLHSEGLQFDFQLIEGLQQHEARKIYGNADVLVDQLLAGWYGGLAVELMALGKPVICYIRESDLKFIPEEMKSDIPIINSDPGSIYDVLKDYLTSSKSQLKKIGEKSRSYVEKWHNPSKIALRLKRDYLEILKERNLI